MKKITLLTISLLALLFATNANALNFQTGEQTIASGQYASIVGLTPSGYRVQFSNGYAANYQAQQLYKTYGCTYGLDAYPACVGNSVIINGTYATATIVGFAQDYRGVEYALRYDDSGSIDTGFFRNQISLR